MRCKQYICKSIIRKYKVVVRNEEGIDCQNPDSIWLIDHCWTWRDRAEAAKQLEEHQNLKSRLEGIFEKRNLQKVLNY